ncbi:Predicted nuclease, contains PIN domain, potential toxin-antitoxin system component [Algoriphagus faecimaris]|uniref:Predicted nuclease, contains PIN domain, potential toxin-antitoxin system component n=1 Tax=Algoriphagus faecimaris TaxID=686796 RepID=A0A1G6MFZ0_9BACT|nr:Predicted nuclease, contains PIN domain, potential toxin-antitoxin system component [Algoriphagus faecimaris]
MKFLCDVHIPFKLVSFFQDLGYESVHVNSILEGSSTKDSEIAKFADEGNYILISKDADFKISFLLKRKPKKLVKINLGNISNKALIEIFKIRIDQLLKLDSKPTFLLEIGSRNDSFIA